MIDNPSPESSLDSIRPSSEAEDLPPSSLDQETNVQDNTLKVTEEPQESHSEFKNPIITAKTTELKRTIIAVKRRMKNISARLECKEYKQLGFVYENYPAQYYRSWKGEANSLFSLLVNYSSRLRDLEQRLQEHQDMQDAPRAR
jgi:hypothetical protein